MPNHPHTPTPSQVPSRPHRRARPFGRLLSALSAGLLVGAAACGDSNGLGDATLPNVVDTFSLGALVGTPVTVPSAFSVAKGASGSLRGHPVRSDQTPAFDFAFNIDGNGQPVFLPQAALGLGSNTSADPGLRVTPLAFADIMSAPSDGYATDVPVPFAVGDRFIVRSRIVCGVFGLPEFGKLEVLALDATARTVTFQILTNNNCGYKDLDPGLPED